MKYERRAVVSADELGQAVAMQYGFDYNFDVACLLFGDDFNNDSCKRFDIGEDEFEWYSEEATITGEHDDQLRALIVGYLRDVLPGEKEVLIDVSW